MTAPSTALHRAHVERLLARHVDAGVADGELLSRFVHQHDQRAFEVLLRRHGSMVLATGRRVLGNPHDAEDVLQATFLLLARQASSRRWQPCVAGWLHVTAHQIALRVRRAAARRTRREQRATARAATNPLAEMTGQELLAVLDEELLALPEPIRTPLVLCYLEGLTRDEAAGRLGCPLATLKKRLERGRDRLHDALVRRGLGLSAVMIGSLLVGRSATAVPLPLVRKITHAVSALADGNAADGVVSSQVLRHIHGGSGMVGGNKIKTALAVLLLGGLLATAGAVTSGTGDDKPAPKPSPAQPAAPKPAPQAAKGIRGKVKDSDGSPVAGATVVAAGADGSGKALRTTTDADGRFAFDHFPVGQDPLYATAVIAAKDGFAPATGHSSPTREDVTLTLPKAATYTGTVKDRAGRAVAGAEVQFGVVWRNDSFSSWGYAPLSALRGTAAATAYAVKTDATGAFRFTSVPDGAELIFRATAPGLAERDTAATIGKREHVAGPGAKPAALVLDPEAIVRGRVTSRAGHVAVTDLTVRLNGGIGGGRVDRSATPDAGGRFEFKGLPAGAYGVFVSFPVGTAAAAAGASVNPKASETAVADLEVVAGVEVTGVVKVKGGDPVADATVVAIGTFNPDGHSFRHVPTDAEGRFRMRLPPGEATVMPWSMPAGYAHPSNSAERRKVTVPSGPGPLALTEPFEAVRVVEGLSGRVTDAAGKPMAHVKVSAVQHASVCGNFASAPVSASFDGTFQLPYSPNGPLEPGRSVPLRIETEDGRRFQAAALVRTDGVAEVRVPTLPGVKGPQDVKPDEFAGVVVDEKGKPLAGVKVHLWDWVDSPENYTFTAADGTFRIKDCGTDRQVQVRYRKGGYSPVMVTRQQVGVKGLVVAMDRATYFEGVVRGPDGKPVGGAIVRADQGPKMLDGVAATHIWTEAKADAEGRYRLHVQPDEYAFHVRVPGVGVARPPKTGVAHGQGQTFDIALRAGVTFKARVIDSVSGKPVTGLRLFDWEQKDMTGTSDAAGEVAIKDMLPGDFTFQVESTGHARWWSEQAVREWEHKSVDDPKTGWQRNFDGLTFDLKPGMAAVTILAEPAVRVTGRVLDPAGKPVGGATVAPARTGSGNSLTGDTRFSVETQADGTFAMTLPASGAAEYNLVAHDGKYGEWRTWANGTLPPIRTRPGQAIDGVELRLTRAAVVRGKVVDAKGRPVAGREVRAHAADGLENRYYDPTTTTKADGTFELKFVRPAEQWVQVAPFWLHGSDAPADTSRTITLKAGQVVEDVTLTAAEDGPK
jgi:RNA polymerase sigma factor (sigma-70 family)